MAFQLNSYIYLTTVAYSTQDVIIHDTKHMPQETSNNQSRQTIITGYWLCYYDRLKEHRYEKLETIMSPLLYTDDTEHVFLQGYTLEIS